MPIQTAAQATLPTFTTTLIGRDREAAAVQQTLRKASTRLVTLVGVSGAGKTRLALQVLDQISAASSMPCYFVPLTPISDPELVIPTIAHVLGIDEVGSEPVQATLIKALESKPLLLLLDNMEQVIASASAISTLLEHTQALKVLVTSQQPLQIEHETVIEIAPLAVPAARAEVTLETALQYPAIALFVERFRDAQPTFQLSAEQLPAISAICTKVRGLPLAIELIAAHSQAFTPQDLLRLLEHHLIVAPKFIHSDSRDQVLWPVLDWCYRRLSAPLQSLFLRMGMFVGGCTLASVEQVCSAPGDIDIDISDGVATLIGKHMVLEEVFADHEVRYVMLDAVREYTQRKLQHQPVFAQLRQAYQQYYQQLVATSSQALKGPDQRQWLNRLEGEQPNLRAALTMQLAGQAAEPVLQMAGQLAAFWTRRGYLREGLSWIEQALAQTHADQSAAYARALDGKGSVLENLGQYQAAIDCYQQVLKLARNLALEREQAESLTNLGRLTRFYAALDETMDYFQQSLALFRKLNDNNAVSVVLCNMGTLLSDHGRYTEALACYEESSVLDRAYGDLRGLGITLNNMGVLWGNLGDYAQAAALYKENLHIREQLNDHHGMAIAYANLGEVAFVQAQPAAAKQYLQRAWEIAQEYEFTHILPFIKAKFADIALSEQDYPQAWADYQAALKLYQPLRDLSGLISCIEGIAYSLIGQQQLLTRAAELLGAASALRQQEQLPLSSNEQERYAASSAQARQAAGAAQWQQHWAAGAAFSLEQALAHARAAAV